MEWMDGKTDWVDGYITVDRQMTEWLDDGWNDDEVVDEQMTVDEG